MGFADALRQLAAIYRADRATRWFAGCSVGAAAALVLLPFTIQLVRYLGAPVPRPPRWLSLSVEGALPELVSYVLASTCAWWLCLIWQRSGVRLFLALAAIFGFVVLDDALKYHETVGAILVERTGLPAVLGLRQQDVGELVAWGFAGVVIAVPLLLALRQPVRNAYGFAGVILACFAALVFFGMVVDMLHMAADLLHLRYLGEALRYVEDGGEMLSIAVACACAYALYRGYAVPELRERLRLPAVGYPRLRAGRGRPKP